MVWTRSSTLALAKQTCTFCHGLGMRPGRGDSERPCECVYRAIFRICHARFRRCASAEPRLRRSAVDEFRLSRHRPDKSRKSSAVCGTAKPHKYGYPDQEYAADFLSAAKRTLGGHSHGGQQVDTLEHRIFTWHHVYGADFRAINRKLGRALDDRATFHDFYRIEEKLGRAFAELKPYALYPLDEYFGGRVSQKPKPSK